jgi:hypothetical protein
MGEHNDLNAVIRHAFGHPFIGGHHAPTEVFALTLNCKGPTAVPNPVGKLRWRVLAQPGNKEFQNLLILDSITVRWVSEENI